MLLHNVYEHGHFRGIGGRGNDILEFRREQLARPKVESRLGAQLSRSTLKSRQLRLVSAR